MFDCLANENQNCVGNNLNSKRARRDASGGVGRAVEKVIMSTPIILKRRDVIDNPLNSKLLSCNTRECITIRVLPNEDFSSCSK